jgi:LCP family protein required for cell wall assembly
MAKKKAGKEAKKKEAKRFDVHRTLPHHAHTSPDGLEKHGATSLDGVAPLEEEPKKRRLTWKKALATLLLLPIIFLLVIGIWDARNFSHASKKMFGSGNLTKLIFSDDLKTGDDGRVNVLLVGYSVDDPGHPAASLTDSLLLLSMNPDSKTGYMLSIPRDLYVNIPDSGYAKINEAYQDGKNSGFKEAGYPKGGMGLLEKVIATNFQTHIDYYALINYGAVREVVDALGGVTVNIKSPDPRGLYDPNISKTDGGPLKLKNGKHKLDGQTALNLTRARGDAYKSYGFPQADFNRTEHQRQVFAAIKGKLTWKLLLDPRENNKVFSAFADNLKTNIKLDEVRPLYTLFHNIPDNKLKSVSLNDLNNVNLLASYATPTGQSALIPAAGIDNYSQIIQAIKRLD